MLCLYSFYLAVQDSVYCKRGSLAYHLVIWSRTIRSCPLPGAIGSPDYGYLSGDGPAALEYMVSFETRSQPKAVIDAIGLYLEARGLRETGREETTLSYESDDVTVVVICERAERAGTWDVAVWETHHD